MWVSKKRLVRPMGTFPPISGQTGVVGPYSGAVSGVECGVPCIIVDVASNVRRRTAPATHETSTIMHGAS